MAENGPPAGLFSQADCTHCPRTSVPREAAGASLSALCGRHPGKAEGRDGAGVVFWNSEPENYNSP